MTGRFIYEPHQQARTREIERIYQENKADIEADIRGLELSMRDMAEKYKVNDHNIRRWAERMGVDTAERAKERRRLGKDNAKAKTNKAKARPQHKAQAHKLVGLW